MGYCAVNKISSFKSKKDLKDIDKLSTTQIQEQLINMGLKTEIMEMDQVSKSSWKQTITLPKGKDFDKEILKRAGIALEDKGKGKKKQRQESVEADPDVDVVMKGTDQDQNCDTEMSDPQEETAEPLPCGQPSTSKIVWASPTDIDLQPPSDFFDPYSLDEDL